MTPQARENAQEFDQEQAALLELLAAQIDGDQDGDEDFNPYGYAVVDTQANGFFPYENFDSTETYHSAELPDDFQQFQEGQPSQQDEDAAIEAAFANGPAGYGQMLEADLKRTSGFDIADFATASPGFEYTPEVDIETTFDFETANFEPVGYEHTPTTDLEEASELEKDQFAIGLVDNSGTISGTEITHSANGPAGNVHTAEVEVEVEVENTSNLDLNALSRNTGCEQLAEDASEHTFGATPGAMSGPALGLKIQRLTSYGSIINPIDVDELSGEEDINMPGKPLAGPLEAIAAVGTGGMSAGTREAVAAGKSELNVREYMKTLEQNGFFVRTFIPEGSPKRLREAGVTLHSLEGPDSYGHKRRKTVSPCKSPSGTGNEGDGGLELQPDYSLSVSHSRRMTSLNRAVYKEPTSPLKASRPVVSKLFKSLGIPQEAFSYLNAAAKDYMLDPNYPDRMACVGNKRKVENDSVKLKLYATVKNFLKHEGWGDRYFGSGASDAATRTLRWPEHEHKVIALLSPLMRRMVSNERQRLYATENRVTIFGSKSKSGTPSATTPSTPTRRDSIQPHTPQQDNEEEIIFSDYNFDQCDFSLASTASTVDGHSPPKIQYENTPERNVVLNERELRFHINLMQDGRRLQSNVAFTPETCPSFSNLVQHIGSLIEGFGQNLKSVQVLGPDGLVDAKDEASWIIALESIRQSAWMDGDVKCIVQVHGNWVGYSRVDQSE